MIDRLEMFVALARERHFGRAAQAVGVTQPTLSAAIRALEEQLGAQLVYRSARFQGLTPEGMRVLEWARKITADARSMRQEVTSARHALSGHLTLGVIPSAQPRVAQLTGPYLDQNPGVSLRILSATSAEILAGIEDHRMDAGVSYLDNEPLGRVSTVALFAERYVLVMRADHDLATADSLPWSALQGQRLCLLTSDLQNRRIISQHLETAGVSYRGGLESNSVLALVAHIRGGGWLSILPAALAQMLMGAADLRAVPLHAPKVHHQIGLILPSRSVHTPLLEALATIARRLRLDEPAQDGVSLQRAKG